MRAVTIKNGARLEAVTPSRRGPVVLSYALLTLCPPALRTERIISIAWLTCEDSLRSVLHQTELPRKS